MLKPDSGGFKALFQESKLFFSVCVCVETNILLSFYYWGGTSFIWNFPSYSSRLPIKHPIAVSSALFQSPKAWAVVSKHMMKAKKANF